MYEVFWRSMNELLKFKTLIGFLEIFICEALSGGNNSHGCKVLILNFRVQCMKWASNSPSMKPKSYLFSNIYKPYISFPNHSINPNFSLLSCVTLHTHTTKAQTNIYISMSPRHADTNYTSMQTHTYAHKKRHAFSYNLYMRQTVP